MSTDTHPAAHSPGYTAQRPASFAMPAKPTLDGIEEKWSRRWDERGVVQV